MLWHALLSSCRQRAGVLPRAAAAGLQQLYLIQSSGSPVLPAALQRELRPAWWRACAARTTLKPTPPAREQHSDSSTASSSAVPASTLGGDGSSSRRRRRRHNIAAGLDPGLAAVGQDSSSNSSSGGSGGSSSRATRIRRAGIAGAAEPETEPTAGGEPAAASSRRRRARTTTTTTSGGSSSSSFQSHLSKHSPVTDVLDSPVAAGLSFAAKDAIIRFSSGRCRTRMMPSHVRQGLAMLLPTFGPELASSMLLKSPILLQYDAANLQRRYEGLLQLFEGKRGFVLDLLRASPELLTHNPETVGVRLESLQQLLQVERGVVLQLAKKSPTYLRCRPSKVSAVVDFLAEHGGIIASQAARVFLSWPMFGTSSATLIKTRYDSLQRLLQAEPADMRRIVASWPNALMRQPAQLAANLKLLSTQLGVPLEQLVGIARQEPGLLSWNVSTLVTRCVSVSQVLRLPPELRLTLLTYHRSLLSHHRSLPERLQVLQRALGVSEAELYPLMHSHLTVLRFPAEAVEAKLAVDTAVAALHPSWQQELERQSPLMALRRIQAGWACHWRLVYLLHTGQQATVGFHTAIRLSHRRFRVVFPDFPHWLNRYNAAVSRTPIPLEVPQLPPHHQAPPLKGPTVYTPILPDASMGKVLHAGSLYIQSESFFENGGQSNSASSSSSRGSSSRGSASSGSSDGSSSGTRGLPATQAGWLADWLNVPLSRAEQFLQEEPRVSSFTWASWQARLQAAGALLQALGHCELAGPGSESLAPASSGSCNSSSGAAAASTGSHLLPDHSQTSSSNGQAPDDEQPSAKLQPPPHATEALGRACASDQAAAVAAVAVACHLPAFSAGLATPLPPPPAAAVVDFVLDHPRCFARASFADSCRKLAALAAASSELRGELAGLSSQALATILRVATDTRLCYLQYLVQTGQPRPWRIELHALLVGSKWPLAPEHNTTSAKFSSLYPGFPSWEQAMQSL